jgi:hypothetical protein
MVRTTRRKIAALEIAAPEIAAPGVFDPGIFGFRDDGD